MVKITHNYVDNEKLTKELAEWAPKAKICIQNNERRPKFPEYVGKAILDICTNLGYRCEYTNYPFKEDMIGDAVEVSVRYCHNFNIEKTTNAFGYLTQIAVWSFWRRIAREKKIYKNQLTYLFTEMDIDDLSSQLGDDKEYYQGYVDSMRKLIDDMGFELEPPSKKTTRKKAKEEEILSKFIG